jgi:hypothetical protein
MGLFARFLNCAPGCHPHRCSSAIDFGSTAWHGVPSTIFNFLLPALGVFALILFLLPRGRRPTCVTHATFLRSMGLFARFLESSLPDPTPIGACRHVQAVDILAIPAGYLARRSASREGGWVDRPDSLFLLRSPPPLTSAPRCLSLAPGETSRGRGGVDGQGRMRL